MRYLFWILGTFFSLHAYSSEVGRLLWEDTKSAINGGKIIYYPDVPDGGKSPANAIKVGIIDSGMILNHPQIAGYIKESKDFTGEGIEDVLGHGTAVALQLLYGVKQDNPPIALINAKVVNAKGNISEENVIKAIDWVASSGAKTVNLSLGFSGTLQEHHRLCETISGHKDTLFTAAAGNDGPNVLSFPAACESENLISVGAVKKNGTPQDYSGKGEIYAPDEVMLIEGWAYYYQQAQVLAVRGELKEARLLYEKSIAIEPNAESEFQIGVLDINGHDTDAAINRFKKAIQIKPELAEAHEMLGAALFIQGNYTQAEKSLNNAIDLYPDEPQTNLYLARAYFNLGQTLLRLNHIEAAKAAFEETKRREPNYPHLSQALKNP